MSSATWFRNDSYYESDASCTLKGLVPSLRAVSIRLLPDSVFYFATRRRRSIR